MRPRGTSGWMGRAGAAAALLCVLPAMPGQEKQAASRDADRLGEVGAVVGTVQVRVDPAVPPPMLSPYARPRYRPPARTGAASTAPETAVVYLRGGSTSGSPAPATFRITQRDRTIIPHVTAVQVGARVDFPNEDDVFHNLFSLSGPHHFNLGRYPPGESRSEQFERAGVVRLFCDIHSEMGGVILVLDTPYFAQPDSEGRFQIAGVPPGEYTAIAWHEVAGADSTRVVIRDGVETTLSFLLGG